MNSCQTHMRQFFMFRLDSLLNMSCDKEHNISKSFYLTDVSVLCLRGSDFIKMKIKIIWRNDLQINPAYL